MLILFRSMVPSGEPVLREPNSPKPNNVGETRDDHHNTRNWPGNSTEEVEVDVEVEDEAEAEAEAEAGVDEEEDDAAPPIRWLCCCTNAKNVCVFCDVNESVAI